VSIFDPTTVNRTLDAYLATIPPGKKVVLIANADLQTRKLSLGAAVKLGSVFTAYAGFTKDPGAAWGGDVGVKASFLILTGNPPPGDSYEFDFGDIVDILEARGFSWPVAMWKAIRLRMTGSIEL
jgi:hypothetical protein